MDDVVVVHNDDSASGNDAIQVVNLTALGGTANTTAITFIAAGAAAPFGRKQPPSESPGSGVQVIPAAAFSFYDGLPSSWIVILSLYRRDDQREHLLDQRNGLGGLRCGLDNLCRKTGLVLYSVSCGMSSQCFIGAALA